MKQSLTLPQLGGGWEPPLLFDFEFLKNDSLKPIFVHVMTSPGYDLNSVMVLKLKASAQTPEKISAVKCHTVTALALEIPVDLGTVQANQITRIIAAFALMDDRLQQIARKRPRMNVSIIKTG